MKHGRNLEKNEKREAGAQNAVKGGEITEAFCACGRGQFGKTSDKFFGEKLKSSFLRLHWAPIAYSYYTE